MTRRDKLDDLRKAVQVGIEQAERGEFSERSVQEIAEAVLAEKDTSYAGRTGNG